MWTSIQTIMADGDNCHKFTSTLGNWLLVNWWEELEGRSEGTDSDETNTRGKTLTSI